MITGLIQATDLPRENAGDGEAVVPSWRAQPLSLFRDILILTAFTLTTNGLRLFVAGFFGERQAVTLLQCGQFCGWARSGEAGNPFPKSIENVEYNYPIDSD